jgi:purine-binding chemotaxis protein CheW
MDVAVWVIFTVGNEVLAVAREAIQRILPLPALGRPPGLPLLVEGVLNYAGVAIPVLRLDRLFGLPTSSLHPYQHLLLLSAAHPPLALLVDRVTEVVRTRPDQVTEIQAGETFNGCVVGQFSHGKKLIHVLSAEKLLLEQERQVLTDFQSIYERRCDEMRSPV